MLSKNKIKLINSLTHSKYRQQEGLYIAEGTKLTETLLDAQRPIATIIATPQWLSAHTLPPSIEIVEADESEMKKITQLSTPSPVMALARIPTNQSTPNTPEGQLWLGLDNIRDPGNMGTIIRLAQWFGIDTIVCNKGTVDCYNPKVVQATMGAIAHVNIHYTALNEFIATHQSEQWPVYGTFLEGRNLFQESLSASGMIVLGNEGQGISDEVAKEINKKILIPDFAGEGQKPESLNVSVAAAIVCAEFRRRTLG